MVDMGWQADYDQTDSRWCSQSREACERVYRISDASQTSLRNIETIYREVQNGAGGMLVIQGLPRLNERRRGDLE